MSQGHDASELVTALRESALAERGALSAAAQCDVAWSLAMLGVLTPDSFRGLCAELEKQSLAAFEPEVCGSHYPLHTIVLELC